MSSRKNKKLHKEISERYWEKVRAEDLAQRKSCLLEETSDLRHRLFVSCAIVESLGGAYTPDFGFWNEAYWRPDFWQEMQERAREMEAEFKRDGSLPDGFYNLPPVEEEYDKSELEYFCKYKPAPGYKYLDTVQEEITEGKKEKK